MNRRDYNILSVDDSTKTKSNRKKIHVLLHLSAGSVLVPVALLADYIRGFSFRLGPIESAILVGGLVIILIGFIAQTGLVARTSANLCLFILGVFMSLSLSEGLFRLVAFDFAGEEQLWRKIPPFYREPIVPTGEVFFRRPGPESWTGQVLNTFLMQQNVLPNPYSNEPVITVKYSKTGFRNPDDISDWDIVVTGDSFTELGYLRNEELFTTLLGKILNVRVLNLGTSYTGPLTQLSYLRDYGISASTKHAVIVFFEGNDLSDLVMEYKALIRWQESGHRDYREFKRQPSVAKALYGLLRGPSRGFVEPTNYVNAYFKSAHSVIPVTLSYIPPGRTEISEETTYDLNYFLGEYARFGTERQITVWLAYMPSNLRVLDGQIQFSDGANEKLRSWRPTDLPDLISELCDQYGIKFIDLTPVLVEETRNKAHLLYNSIYDTHINSLGSAVVAREMAHHFMTQTLR